MALSALSAGADDGGMFAALCPRTGTRSLITPERILGLENTAEGIRVHFVCWCGALGLWVSGRGHDGHAHTTRPAVDHH